MRSEVHNSHLIREFSVAPISLVGFFPKLIQKFLSVPFRSFSLFILPNLNVSENFSLFFPLNVCYTFLWGPSVTKQAQVLSGGSKIFQSVRCECLPEPHVKYEKLIDVT